VAFPTRKRSAKARPKGATASRRRRSSYSKDASVQVGPFRAATGYDWRRRTSPFADAIVGATGDEGARGETWAPVEGVSISAMPAVLSTEAKGGAQAVGGVRGSTAGRTISHKCSMLICFSALTAMKGHESPRPSI
jgi:hypothetical protein